MSTSIQEANPQTRAEAKSNAARKPFYEIDPGEDQYKIRIFMPGVKKDGTDVSIERDILTINGYRKLEEPEHWRAIRRELSNADFRLRLHLNTPVDEQKADAKMEDGVLHLTLPVAESAKPRRVTVT